VLAAVGSSRRDPAHSRFRVRLARRSSIPLFRRTAARSPRRGRVLESTTRRQETANALDHVVTNRHGSTHPWRRLTSRPVTRIRGIRVREDRSSSRRPDDALRVVQCAGCVGVLPFLDAETVVLVGQYRYVAALLLGMPTGRMKAGESEESAVQRELAEEAGYEADGSSSSAPITPQRAVVDETAKHSTSPKAAPGRASGRSNGVHRGARLSLRRGYPHGRADEIKDSMTIVAVLHRRAAAGPLEARPRRYFDAQHHRAGRRRHAGLRLDRDRETPSPACRLAPPRCGACPAPSVDPEEARGLGAPSRWSTARTRSPLVRPAVGDEHVASTDRCQMTRPLPPGSAPGRAA